MSPRVPLLDDIDCRAKTVLTRVDFNVPVHDGVVLDDRRIAAAIPTIQYLREHGAKTVLVTHFGRPKGKRVAELSTKFLVEVVQQHLGAPVAWCEDVVGDKVEAAIAAMKPGDVLMLENVRFEPGEGANDPDFAGKLAALADIWCMDAFGAAHRANASTEGVGHLLPGVAGRLMEKEIRILSEVFEQPRHPAIAIIGGAKISTKIGVLNHLLDKLDAVWIGGAMACTFLCAQGLQVGNSLIEEDQIAVAEGLLKGASGSNIKLPIDVVVTANPTVDSETTIVDVNAIPADRAVVDIGPKTIELMAADIRGAALVTWNGPVGVYEIEAYSQGTRALARIVGGSSATSIVGGGDLAAAIDDAGVADQITHISTGGGATLEFLEGKKLPSIAVLEQQRINVA